MTNATTMQTITDDADQDNQLKRELRIAKLDSFGASLAKTKKEAVDGRANSGLETDWAEDEDAYQGIDDANRSALHNKPSSPNGGYIGTPSNNKDPRSTVFLNVTRPYVDAAAAKVADMLLPTEEKNWAIKPTPIPKMKQMKDDQTQMLDANLNPMMKSGVDAQGQPVQAPVTVADHVSEIFKLAANKAERAEKHIEDWLVECQYSSEVRKVIEDTARLGVGVLKGPFPVATTSKIVSKEGGITKIELEQAVKPASKRVDPWNFYPDPTCGENIHEGAYTWEKDSLTGHQVRELLEDSTYIREQLERVLEEGPAGMYTENKGGNHNPSDKDRYEVWYFNGYATKENMEAAGCKCEEHEQIPAIIVTINDHVVKGVLSPFDSGEFPYDVMVWQRRTDNWAGVGVSRQMRTPQRMLNAATRNMMDNAGLSAGPQLVIRRGIIEPADGSWAITPRKLWFATEDADVRSTADAFTAINIPTMQGELMGIIQFANKMAEDVTGLPMLLQGQQGSAPETVGGMTMLNNNASTVMRRIARTFDDRVTRPHIRRYYEFLLTYGEDEDEKGDFQIDARGSSSLVERDLQNQFLAQSLQLSLDPRFEISPARALKEYLQSQRIDVRKLEYSEEEKAQQQQQAQAQAQQQPQDPRQITAEASLKVAQLRSEAELNKANAQIQSDQTEMQLRMQDAREDRAFRLQEMNLTREIKMLELANSQKISLDKIKAQLADTAMKEKNKREIFATEAQLKRDTGQGI
jgi:hypothetical protein